MSDDLGIVLAAEDAAESASTAKVESAGAVAEAVQPVSEPVEVQVEDAPVDAVKPEDGIIAPEVVEPQEVSTEIQEPEASKMSSPEVEPPGVLEAPSVRADIPLSEPVRSSQPISPLPVISGAVGLQARRAKRAARVQRIFELKKLGRPITNNDVQLLLRVSHVTATTYLNMLVVSGKLFAEGRGRGRIYRFL